MKAIIYFDDTEKEIDIPNKVSIIERLDRAMNASSFDFFDTYNKNYAPFSIIKIENKFYFFSTTCNKYVTLDNTYLHNAILVEPTKILQALLVGSKGFRVKKDDDTETNYNRVLTLVDVIRTKYFIGGVLDGTNIEFRVSPTLKTSLTHKRDYNFGSGTTLYDAISEIMSTEGVLLKCSLTKSNYVFVLTIAGVSLIDAQRAGVGATLEKPQSLSTSQNTDDYCKMVESEFGDVIDLNTYQYWYGTPRADGVLSDDNVELHLPTKIHKATGSYLYYNSYYGDVTTVERNYSFYSLSRTIYGIKIGYLHRQTLMVREKEVDRLEYYVDKMLNDCIDPKDHTLVKARLNQFKARRNTVFFNYNYGQHGEDVEYVNLHIVVTENYVSYIWFVDLESEKKDGFVYYGNLLDEKQFETLDINERPSFMTFQHGSNVITNLRNEYKGVFVTSTETVLTRPIPPSGKNYGDYLLGDVTRKGTVRDLNGLKYWSIEDYHFQEGIIPSFNVKATDVIYGIEYIAMDSMFNTVYKSVESSNEFVFKGLSKSYSNGGNNVDMDAIQSDMQREVDFLGNTETALTSFKNYELATRLTDGREETYGYVISKETIITPTLRRYVYNVVKDLNYIASEIGVATQYESTRVIFENVVDRHIYLELPNYKLVFLTTYRARGYECYLVFNSLGSGQSTYSDFSNAMLKMSYLEDASNIYLVANTYSNYILGFRQGQNEENNGAYRSMIPVLLGDRDGIATSYNVSIIIEDPKKINMFDYNMLPLTNKSATSSNTIIANETMYVYKDSSERLIFTFKIRKY